MFYKRSVLMGTNIGIWKAEDFKMRQKKLQWKRQKEPPLFPKWLKSYHLLLFAFIVMLIFGAIMKYMSTN